MIIYYKLLRFIEQIWANNVTIANLEPPKLFILSPNVVIDCFSE